MKTVLQLPVGTPREQDLTKFPDSNVINETDDNPGTPVVREVYGDILVNLYRLLRLAKIEPNGIEDNELNGYQIVQALKKFTNDLNDIEQLLNLNGSVFSINIDLSILPNRYVCIVRSAETYVTANNYTFKGTGPEEYPFQAVSGFSSGDSILLIIDTGTVRAYSFSKDEQGQVPAEIFTPFGDPLAFNDNEKLYYQNEGVLFSDLPDTYDLQSAIRVYESDGTLLVYEMLLISGYLYCLVFYPNTLAYKFYRFAVNDFSTPLPVALIGTSFPVGIDNKPNIYTDGIYIYITNDTGNSANNSIINNYLINFDGGSLASSGSITIDPAFKKTTNAVVKNNNLFTFVAGDLIRFSLATGTMNFVNSFPTYIGLLFQYKDNPYYSNGEVAKKWTLA